MKTYLIFGIGLSLIAGCADNRPGMSYKIIIDPSVDAAMVEVQGAQWEAVIPELKLSYEIAACNIAPTMHSICIFLDNDNPPYSSLGIPLMHTDVSDYDSDTIHIYSSSIESNKEHKFAFSNGILHELGHSLGNSCLHIGEGNVMYAKENGDVEEQLQQDDIKYFWMNR